MRKIAGDPEGPVRDPPDCAFLPGIRSLHLRHLRQDRPRSAGEPVHVIYYCAIQAEVIEIVRVLHERMDPSRHIGAVHAEPEE